MTTYYELRENNTIGRFTNDKEIADELSLCYQTESEIIYGYDGNAYIKGQEPTKPLSEWDFDSVAETHLSKEMADRGYTTHSPAEYINSSNERWAQDAEDWVAHLTEVMEYTTEIENKCKAGEPVPTIEEFKENLPSIQWTVAV